jgi:hypothetical protein
MTEHEWRIATDPLEMLRAVYPLRSHGSEVPQSRACRAYLFACARAQWDRLPEPARALVALGELADETPTRGPLWHVLEHASEELRGTDSPPAAGTWLSEQLYDDDLAGAAGVLRPALARLAQSDRFRFDPGRAAPLDPHEWGALARLVALSFHPLVPPFVWVPRDLHSAELVRETHGFPFGAARFDPRWRTTDAVALARQMHETGDFRAMPILADALQEAGCGEPAVLDHCRAPSVTHARGCWVLARVLNLS